MRNSSLLLLLTFICVFISSCTEKAQEPEIPQPETVQKIKLSKNYEIMIPNESFTLTYTIEPTSLQDKCSVLWSSSDKSLATVENGIVTCLRGGQCKIVALVEGTSIYDTCIVLINHPEIPPTITFSNFQCEGDELTLEQISDTKCHATGAHAQKRVSGHVEFRCGSSVLSSVTMTFKPSQVHSWGISLLDWSSDWMTSRIEQPQNGLYSYSYRGGYSSKFSFSFIPTGSDPISVPITFSVTNYQGLRTSIELTFTN